MFLNAVRPASHAADYNSRAVMYVRSPEGLFVWEEHHHRTATADPEPRGSREAASCLVVRVENLIRDVLAHVGVEVVAVAEHGGGTDVAGERVNLNQGGGLREAEKSELPSGKASQKITQNMNMRTY